MRGAGGGARDEYCRRGTRRGSGRARFRRRGRVDREDPTRRRTRRLARRRRRCQTRAGARRHDEYAGGERDARGGGDGRGWFGGGGVRGRFGRLGVATRRAELAARVVAPRPRGAVFADGQGVPFAGGEADAAREVYVARGRGRGLARRPAPSEGARGVATGAVDEEDDVRPTRGDGSWVLARVRRRVDETRREDVVARARGCRGWFLQDVVARALAPRVQSPAGRVVRVDARDGEPPSPVERVPRRRHRRGARHQSRVARVAPGPPVGKEPALVPRPRAHRVARARRGPTRWAPASPRGETTTTRGVGARRAGNFLPSATRSGRGFPYAATDPRRSPTDRDDDDGHPGDGEGAQGAQGC